MMKVVFAVVLLVVVCPALSERKDWHFGVDSVNPRGARVHGHTNTPSHNGFQGTAHGSRVFGGPYNGAQSLGGGANYNHPSGLHGGVDATHTRGRGTSYSGHVGGSARVGGGRLSVDGRAGNRPGSSRVDGHIGGSYSRSFKR